MKKTLSFFLMPVTILIATQAIFASVQQELNSLTGNIHTRIAWLRGSTGDRTNGGGALVGFDSQTGQLIELLPAAVKQNRPIICSGGHRVVVTIDYKVYIMDWDAPGSKTFLVNGIASDVWIHPTTGKEWVVVRTGGYATTGKVYRYLIEDPTQSFLLWDKTEIGINYFQWWQISADGKLAVDFQPWPDCFLIEDGGITTNGTSTRLSGGCWSSVAPDNSYYWFNLRFENNHHDNIKIFNNTTFLGKLYLNPTPRPPGTISNEHYHPKFASKGADFITVSSGYTDNKNSDKAEVYIGKFAPDHMSIPGWVRLTNDESAPVPDYTPEAWVGVETNGPSIILGSSKITFEGEEGASNPPAKNVTVTTPTGVLENVKATNNQAWLTTSVSGSNASYTIKNSTNIASLSAGLYEAIVTVSADNTTPATRTYAVSVTVLGEPVASTVTLSPQSATVSTGESFPFTATVLDQEGTALSPQPQIAWSTTGNANTISSGSFIAGDSAGTFTVTATSGSATGAATILIETSQKDQITITSPSGREHYQIGDKVSVTWSATSIIPGVIIEISTDGALSWMGITEKAITRSDSAWGNFEWTIPETINSQSLVSSNVVLRIYDYAAGLEISAQTPSSFSISEGGTSAKPLTISARLSETRVATGPDGLRIRIPFSGSYGVALYSVDGKCIREMKGYGPQNHSLKLDAIKGTFILRATAEGSTILTKRLVLR